MRYPWMHGAAVALLTFLAGCTSLDTFTEGPAGAPATPPNEPTPNQIILVEDARDLAAAGQYDEALGIFQDILADNPTITVAYIGIGDVYLQTEDYEKAEPAYRRAARLEPRNFEAQYGHGLALQMLTRFVEAVQAYHRALTIRPDDADANLNLATTYLQLEDPQRAVVFAEKAVEADPSNGASHANLGAIYEELGRSAEAVDAYLAAIELMGNQSPLLLNLISALTQENRYREAANTADNLIRIEPSAEAYERLGWCYFKLREYNRSIEAYRDAVFLDPEYWPALNGIGVNALNTWLLSKRRDSAAFDEARDAFRRSLQANTDQPRVVSLILNYEL